MQTEKSLSYIGRIALLLFFLLIFRFISVCLLLLMKKIGFIYFRLAKICSIYNCFDAVAV